MSIAYSRKLDEINLVRHFLGTVLSVEANEKEIRKLVAVERKLAAVDFSNSTLTDRTKWLKPHDNTDKRFKLRNKIADELFRNRRINNEEKIKPGVGGCRPPKGITSKKQAYILIGLPAAGKSGIANRISDATGSFILDSDYAKRKIPEFYATEIGASLTHDESDSIVMGSGNFETFLKFTPLFFRCVQNGHNIVIPKIGAKPQSISDIAEILVNLCGYTVHLILVNLNRQHATKRAYKRYMDRDRYVPLSLIFDGYANDPTITYFRLRERDKFFSSYGEIDTTSKPYKKIGTKNSIIFKIAL